MNTPVSKEELTVAEAAEILGISPPALIDLLGREGIRYRFVGV